MAVFAWYASVRGPVVVLSKNCLPVEDTEERVVRRKKCPGDIEPYACTCEDPEVPFYVTVAERQAPI